jgi:hypothetical protein
MGEHSETHRFAADLNPSYELKIENSVPIWHFKPGLYDPFRGRIQAGRGIRSAMTTGCRGISLWRLQKILRRLYTI